MQKEPKDTSESSQSRQTRHPNFRHVDFIAEGRLDASLLRRRNYRSGEVISVDYAKNSPSVDESQEVQGSGAKEWVVLLNRVIRNGGGLTRAAFPISLVAKGGASQDALQHR
jgi:hypothetical protein